MSKRKKNRSARELEQKQAPVSTVGQTLRDARESVGLSYLDAADALNLPGTVIQHLEDDVYDELPGPAFSIGYLRAYAKLLELDPDKLVALIQEQQQNQDEPELVAQAVPVLDRIGAVTESSGLLLGLLIVSSVVLVGIALWWLVAKSDVEIQGTAQPEKIARSVQAVVESQEPEPRSVAEAIQSNEAVSANPAGEISAAAINEVAATENAAATEAAASESEVLNQLTAAQNSGIRQTASVANRFKVSFEEGAGRITPEGTDVIDFVFTEDSWVAVRSLDRSDLYADLSRRGSSLKLIGQAPFRILLGFAPGVSLRYNGEAVDLVSLTRNNVARVIVGR